MIKRCILIWCCCCTIFQAEAQQLRDTVRIVQVDIVADINLAHKGVNKITFDSLVLVGSINANLSELLIKNSPIFIKSYGIGGLASASFRGTAPSHTQVLWNEIPLNSPMVGLVDLSLLPVFFADDISLYYGSSSLVKGSGALGGTILIENKADWNNRVKMSLVQGLGSFQNYQTFISVGVGNNKFQSNTRILRETAENDYPYYNNIFKIDTRQTNASYSKYGLMQEIYCRLGDKSSLSFKGWGLGSDRNMPPLTTTDNTSHIYKENQKDISINAVAEFKHILHQGFWNLIEGVTTSNMIYFRKDNTHLMDSAKNQSSIYFTKINFVTSFSKQIAFETGLSYTLSGANNQSYKQNTSDSLIRTVLDTSFSAHRNEFSALLRMSARVNNRLSLFILFRQNAHDKILEPIIPSLSGEYQLLNDGKLGISSNIARNYHLPTLDDLYFVPGGNSKLKPEAGYTADLTLKNILKQHNWTVESRISGFASSINNWIVWNYTSFNNWTPENKKKVFSRGIEANLTAQANFLNWKYNLRVNYSYTRTTSAEKDTSGSESTSYGKQLIYIPMHLYNLLIDVSYKTWYINYSLNYTGNRYTTSDNEKDSMLPRYLLNNAAAGKKLTRGNYNGDLQFRVNNIFNTSYQPLKSRAMPGINYEILLRINFNK